MCRFWLVMSWIFSMLLALLAGASIGGSIAVNYALQAPERVEKLVLLASIYCQSGDA